MSSLLQQPDNETESLFMIRDSAAAFAVSAGGITRARAARFRETALDRDVWMKICDLGWPGLRAPESKGGLGLGMRELCTLLEQLGRHLVPEPLAQCIIIAPLLDGEDLTRLLSGSSIVLPTWQEQVNTLVEPPATRFENGKVIGRKLCVYEASSADGFIVPTKEGLVHVAATAKGLTITSEPTLDGGHIGSIEFLNAFGTLLACPPEAMDAAFDDLALAWSAYLLGVMDAAFELTLEYIKTRVQFDRPIGQFQVVQHRMADMMIQTSLARASLESAAASLDTGVRGNLRKAAVSRAKARVSDTALFVTKEAIQLHGAIGYTDECDIGLFLRKALTLANVQGSAALHRGRYASVHPEDQDE